MKLFITQSYLTPCYFLFIRYAYFPRSSPTLMPDISTIYVFLLE